MAEYGTLMVNPLSEIFQHGDVFRGILSWLDPFTVCSTTTLVCHYWNKTCKHDRIWDEFVRRDFASSLCDLEKEIFSELSTSYSIYQFFRTSFSWNTSLTPSEITFQKDVYKNAFSLAQKNSHSPDITYVIGKKGFLPFFGSVSWSIKISFKGSEMRIGFTTNPRLIYQRYTLSEPEIWIWSDGGGIYSAAARVSDGGRYGMQDVVGVELDFLANCCNFYKNGQFSGKLKHLPGGPLFPLVALDAQGDIVEITMGIKKI